MNRFFEMIFRVKIRLALRHGRRMTRRFWAGESGQAAVELGLLLPFLVILVCGVVEFGRLIEMNHAASTLVREGANVASRGATMNEALTVTRENQSANGLGTEGGVIVTRVQVDDGVPRVVAQVANGDYAERSRVGGPDSVATPYVSADLTEGHTYYAVELFVPYAPVTPLRNLLDDVVPAEIYDRALF
jgi:Flp pilus assembly protein TadG